MMSWYLLTVYVHLLATIFLVGYALFWTILSLAAGAAAGERLAQVGRAQWPPASIPAPIRLPIAGLGWVGLLVLAATGLLILPHRGMTLSDLFAEPRLGANLFTKMLLVLALAVFQLLVTLRPAALKSYLLMVATLAVVALSVSIGR